jgi:hypothetical protein
MLRFNIHDSVKGMQLYFLGGDTDDETFNNLFKQIVDINNDHYSRNIVWRRLEYRRQTRKSLETILRTLTTDWENEYSRTENVQPGEKSWFRKFWLYIRRVVLFVLSPSVCAILVLITTWLFAGAKLEADFKKYENGCALIRANNTFDIDKGIKTVYTEYLYFNDGWYSYGQNCTTMCLTPYEGMYIITENYKSIYPGPCFKFDKQKDEYVCEADNTNRSIPVIIDDVCITENTILSSTVLLIISGVMTFMLTWSLNVGLDQEKELIKLYEALTSDVKAMTMFLVHLTEDKQKYKSGLEKAEMSEDAKDQFFKMQLLLTQLAPTARKILQGKRSYIFPEYHGDSNSFFDDLIEGRVTGERYGTADINDRVLLFFGLLAVISIPLGTLRLGFLYAGGPTLFIIFLVWIYMDKTICGWKGCCKATPYVDVDDLETIPYYTERPERLHFCWRTLFLLCSKSTSRQRDYRRWSDECYLGKCPGVEKSLYNKIKTISEETTMDLFETEMSVLLDEITRLSENNLGFGESKNVLEHLIYKWHDIYSSYGTLQSIAKYSEPFSVLSYRAGMLFAYSFLVPYKYIQLHDTWRYGKKTTLTGVFANGDNFSYAGNAQGFLPDPYIYWSVLETLVFAYMWWCGYYIRKPFSKSLLRRYAICGRQKTVDKITEDTQIQVNNLINNARRYDEQDYKKGFRYGWGGISTTNFTPIGLTQPKPKYKWVDNYNWRDCIEKMLTLNNAELLKLSAVTQNQIDNIITDIINNNMPAGITEAQKVSIKDKIINDNVDLPAGITQAQIDNIKEKIDVMVVPTISAENEKKFEIITDKNKKTIIFPTILWVYGFQQFVNMFPLNRIIDNKFNINNHPEKNEILRILKELDDKKEGELMWETRYLLENKQVSKLYTGLFKHGELTTPAVTRARILTYQPLTF